MTLLYAAFAVVALWLIGELLLQRRAPLHWRALALLGFLVLVAGVAQRTLPLIGVGVVAFGAGQALATRAVKHAAGADYWTLVAPESVPLLGRLFGAEARPEPVPEFEPEPEPEPLVEPEPVPVPEAVEATAVFQTTEYAVEGDSVYYAQQEYPQQQAEYYAYTDPYAQQPYQEQYQEQAYQEQQYQQPYQEQQYQQPYQEYAQYQQYPQQYSEQQQYVSYDQQAYTSYEQQQYAQPQQQPGYDYEQAGYYTPDQQYHAPQG